MLQENKCDQSEHFQATSRSQSLYLRTIGDLQIVSWSSLPVVYLLRHYFFFLWAFAKNKISGTPKCVAFHILWIIAGAQITHGDQVQQPAIDWFHWIKICLGAATFRLAHALFHRVIRGFTQRVRQLPNFRIRMLNFTLPVQRCVLKIRKRNVFTYDWVKRQSPNLSKSKKV